MYKYALTGVLGCWVVSLLLRSIPLSQLPPMKSRSANMLLRFFLSWAKLCCVRVRRSWAVYRVVRSVPSSGLN